MIDRLKKIIRRKWFVFGQLYRPIIPFKVNILYWRKSKHEHNVGDLLSIVLVDYLKIHFKLNGKFGAFRTSRLSCIGSVIEIINYDAVVWGSGLLNENSINNVRSELKLDFRAVRGPKTYNKLVNRGFDCPQIYGDSAILLPLFYKPSVMQKKKYVLIPHYSKLNNYDGHENVLSTITKDWKTFIDVIASSELVISASLHGLILAEAYGVPAILLNDVESDLFKYDDYYQSTGREKYKVASTLEQALELGPEKLPDFSKLQHGLINSFPVDLWN